MGSVQCATEPVVFGRTPLGTCATRSIVCTKRARNPPESLTWSLAPGADRAFADNGYNRGHANLEGSDSTHLRVEYCPTTRGTHRAVMWIRSNHPEDFSIEVALEGTGGAPDIDVRPAAVDFGLATLIVPVRRTITIHNVGSDDLVVAEATVDSPAFTLRSPATGTVPAGGTMALQIQLQPTMVGAVRGTLRIGSNDPDEPSFAVELTGHGLHLPPCEYAIVPPILDFGDVERGRQLRRAVEIRNVGSADCLLGPAAMRAGSAPELSVDGAPRRIAPGAAAIVAVELAPDGLGLFEGELELAVSSTIAPSPTVRLRGTGVESAPIIADREIDFGPLGLACAPLTRTVTLYNVGSAAISIDPLVIEPADGPFTLSDPAALPQTVQPGASASFTVTFDPTAVSQHAAAVRIDGSTGRWWVGLEAEGAATARRVERFPHRQGLDLLLAIDDSRGHADEHAGLVTNAGAFAPRGTEQVAVTTLDVEFGASGRLLPVDRDPGARVITGAAFPSSRQALAERLRSIGAQGSGNSQGLMAAYLATSSPLSFGHNAGFLRRDADLAVVLVSNQEDFSTGPLATYLDAFRAIKGSRRANSFSFSAITGDVPGGCSGPGGMAAAAPRYLEVVERTGGTFASICTADWSLTASEVSVAARGPRSRYFLGSVPVMGSIRVVADGVAVPFGGWRYDAAVNAIDLERVVVGGADVEIAYDVACPAP